MKAHISPACGFEGDLWVAPDGGLDGFCLDPARPDLRCWVEILVEDRLAVTLLAREPREDLAARGYPDTRHGFRARLASDALSARTETFVWARVKGQGRGFAQRLLTRSTLAEPVPAREAALARDIGDMSARLEQLCRASQGCASWAAPGWHAHFGHLADLLGRQGGWQAPAPDLPFARDPGISFVLPIGSDITASLHRLAWLAPLARARRAEVLALTTGAAEVMAWLAAVPNLRQAAAAPDVPRAAARHARGQRVVLLDPDDPAPSLAVLGHVLDDGRDVLGPEAPTGTDWRLPASPGVLAVVPRDRLRLGWSGLRAAEPGQPIARVAS